MKSEIAQIVAIVIHGNASLRDKLVTEFPTDHSILKFCKYVRYVHLHTTSSELSEEVIADDTEAWFAYLKKWKTSAIRLKYLPTGNHNTNRKMADWMLAGFAGGGGRWVIEAHKINGFEDWEARWQPDNKERTDDRIWQVTYGRIAKSRRTTCQPAINLEHVKLLLNQKLAEIASFAKQQSIETFANNFERALLELNSSAPGRDLYHRDLVTTATPLHAAQLLAAAQAAWVFGGMGSWNDLCFKGAEQLEYERLSAELFDMLCSAIVEATNSSAPPESTRQWWRIWG